MKNSTRRRFLGNIASVSALLSTPGRTWDALRAELWRPAQRDIATAMQGAGAKGWSPKLGPLMTRWSSKVDARMPHPEYPRPQMVRNDWLNLNGMWEFQPGSSPDELPPFGKTLAGAILVPYPVESALSGVMQLHDRLWYRRMLKIPAGWRGRQILLHFGAVDWEAEVFVNGKSAGVHRGGYDPFSYDITSMLSHEDDELIIRVFDPTQKGGQPRGKQNTEPRGITYTPTTGIWQTVWLEPVNAASIEDLNMIPDIDRGHLKLKVTSSKARSDSMVDVAIKAGSAVVVKMSVPVNADALIPIPSSRLWSPDTPFLYTMQLSLRQGGSTVDSVSTYFGMRKLTVGDADGHKKLLLNNQFVFQIGPLDQGFWPDGIYTAPTDEALKDDILQMKAMGFNMVRKHIKVEPARWYYWADTLGLMVWQDMPSCNSYPGRAFVPPPEDKAAFERELIRMVETHRNVPSIVLWTVFNEAQGQFDTGRMVDIVRGLDPSRPINEASGGQITGAGDINDIHSYPEPAVRLPNGRQALVCGEFGGIGYLIPDHSWQRVGHGYVECANATDLLYLYAEFLANVKRLRDEKSLSAVVYTELTDVMTEVNGMLTYDRVLKLPAEQIRQINSFNFKAPTYRILVPTSETSPQTWRYTTAKPEGAWFGKQFDDSQWQTGAAPYGDEGHVGTPWNTPDLWLRRHFHPGVFSLEELQDLVLVQYNRGRVEIFLNGVQTFAQQGNNRSLEGGYEHRPLSTDVRATIIPGADNLIAVHCSTQPAGGPLYFDAGLALRMA
jgi:hypothetical protein